MTVSWMFTPHPNTLMSWFCFMTLPVHGHVGGTVNWISMVTGVVLSSFWGMSVAFDTQLNDARRCSLLSMCVASGQMFLVQSNILEMKRVVSNRQHMSILGAYFMYHAARYSAARQRRDIEWDDRRKRLELDAAAAPPADTPAAPLGAEMKVEPKRE